MADGAIAIEVQLAPTVGMTYFEVRQDPRTHLLWLVSMRSLPSAVAQSTVEADQIAPERVQATHYSETGMMRYGAIGSQRKVPQDGVDS